MTDGWEQDLSSIGPSDWTPQRARHLLDRAGFGGPPEEVARLAAMPPEAAVATTSEIDYLQLMVNEVFPQVVITAADVDSHYSGVRPLPYMQAGTTSAIPRGHWIESTVAHGFPLDTLIGGKLTTCRALGEQVADRIRAAMQRTR